MRGPITPVRPITFAGKSEHPFPPRQWKGRRAPALPLILAFSPVAKNAAEAKESEMHGLGRVKTAIWRDRPVPKTVGLQAGQCPTRHGINPRPARREKERVRVPNTPTWSGLGRDVQTLVPAPPAEGINQRKSRVQSKNGLHLAFHYRLRLTSAASLIATASAPESRFHSCNQAFPYAGPPSRAFPGRAPVHNRSRAAIRCRCGPTRFAAPAEIHPPR